MRRMASPEPSAQCARDGRWLAIVGIGEDGAEGLGPAARALIGNARIVFGGKRHLALANGLLRGEVRPWPRPFDAAVDEVVRRVTEEATGRA